LKVVVVSSGERPILTFVAKGTIEVGDELLFDYNDRQSWLPFLRSCPICEGVSEPPSRKPAAVTEPIVPLATTTSAGDPRPSTSATADVTASRKRRRDEDDDDDDVASPDVLALATTPQRKAGRQQLYDAVKVHFPLTLSTLLTRSTLESWLPGVCDDNVKYILGRRRQQTANIMLRRFHGVAAPPKLAKKRYDFLSLTFPK